MIPSDPTRPPNEVGPVERPNANCPILAGLSRITDLTQDIQHTMRQLRRDLGRCKTCPAGPQCPIMQEYQDHISRAIADIMLEFGLP
jgi:hypothetical protein